MTKKVTWLEAYSGLMDALETVEIGYPYYGVPESIRDALIYLESTKPKKRPARPK